MLNESCLVKTCKPSIMFTRVPEVDLSDPEAKSLIIKASKECGFFKVVQHGVAFELITNLENEVLRFFHQPQPQKDKVGPPDPCGYGSRKIGANGDEGWLEYLLINTNPDDPKSLHLFQQNPANFRSAVEDYIGAVKNLCSDVLELMADGLGVEPRNVFSRLTMDERSDCLLRVNRYPVCAELDEFEALSEQYLIGFGEHTDPQIISVLRSNNSHGLQICLRDGTWASIPPDQTSFFVIVGDLLQVMTNGRFKSVKHRVLTDSTISRISIIYFGGPPLNENIAPLPSLVLKEEESLYKELTWQEYKTATFKSRLSDNRLRLFEKFPSE
ncbi:Gibberellin 2-beta-dioxygenase [Glycine soja]|uniref:gibberellin 2beta-dioxygenase n=1 Tax=Glycine soja TaxID=3848 RepID=A0A0B2QZH2_GLYSO|nr:gibberellin 2-beta-dioxygenase-like [Glycine soja]KHN26925.1 Gibberellin 2-beta-dioxygenase [Glycine soja]RZB86909.1 Gibberellin 2-beta-dioxygenase [Glycine soja]